MLLAPVPQTDLSTLLRRRIAIALGALMVIVVGGAVMLWSIGRYHMGPKAWPFGDVMFFVITTITTVGFGELPGLNRMPGGHLITAVILLLGLGTSLYAFSAVTTYFVEGEFTRNRQRRRNKKMLDRITDHIIVCGVGTTGIHVVEELIAVGQPLVAVDVSEDHLARAQSLSTTPMPVVQGDATEDSVLEQAGIRRAKGLVAALTDDKANLFIVVTARELNPHLRIVAKGVEVKAAEKLRHAGADRVVNPAYIGGARMVSEMIRPRVVEFLDQMLRDKDKNLRIEEVPIPTGSPLCTKPLSEAQLRRHGNVLVIAVRDSKGGFRYNPGPETILEPEMLLIVLGETAGVQQLREALK
jgi:voltage-gated potassium channel